MKTPDMTQKHKEAVARYESNGFQQIEILPYLGRTVMANNYGIIVTVFKNGNAKTGRHV